MRATCLISALGLIACSGPDEEAPAQGCERGMVEVVSAGFDDGVATGWWFTSQQWRIAGGALEGRSGQAVLALESAHPTVALTITSLEGEVAIGYQARGIRTGYDPEGDPDPTHDLRAEPGYHLTLTGGEAILGETLEDGQSAELGRAPLSFDGPRRLTIASEPTGEVERVRVLADGEPLIDATGVPLGPGATWVQPSSGARVTVDDVSVSVSGCHDLALEPAGALPAGGVTSFAYSAADPQTVWVATAYAALGVWRSRDGGQTFHRVHQGLHFLASAADPADADHVLVGDKIGQIHRSVNGGLSWTTALRAPVVDDPGRLVGIYGLAFDPNVPGRVVAASADGAFITSTDGGESWSRSEDAFPDATSLALSSDGTRVAVGTSRGVYRATGGGSFSEHGAVGGLVLGVAFQPGGSELLAASTEGLFRATESGFEQVDGVPAPVHDVSWPAGERVYAATGQGVWRSEDAGATWQAAGDGVLDPMVHLVSAPPFAPDTVYAATPDHNWWIDLGGGYVPPHPPVSQSSTLFRSTDGGAGFAPLEGLSERDGVVIAVAAERVLTASMCSRGLFRSADGGTTFTHLTADGTRYPTAIAMVPGQPDSALVATANRLIRTDDGGTTWQTLRADAHYASVTAGPGGLVLAGTSTVAAVGVDSAGGSVQGDTGEPAKIFRAAGPDFESVLTIETGEQDGEGVVALAIAPSDPNQVWAAVTGEEEHPMFGAYASTDGGRTWQLRSEGLPTRLVADIAVHPGDPAIVYAATELGVARTDDAGAAWRLVDGRLAEAVLVTPEGLVLAGTGSGLVVSNGADFVAVARGTEGRLVEAVAWNPATGRAYAAIQNLGIRTADLTRFLPQ